MKKHIEKIKQRSPEERKRIATIFAGVTTVIIIILWLILLTVFKSPEEKEKSRSNADSFNVLFEKIGSEFSEIGDSLEREKESFKEMTTEIEMMEETKDPQGEGEGLLEDQEMDRVDIISTELEPSIN